MPTQNSGYDPAELLCRIFLAFKTDYIFIDDFNDFIVNLKRLSNTPPYTGIFGKVLFESSGGEIKAPQLQSNFEEMCGLMLEQDPDIPEKYNFVRSEMIDYCSNFTDLGIDPRFLKKLAEVIEKKNNREWEYKLLKKNNPLVNSKTSVENLNIIEESKEENGETIENQEFGK
jgi:hypothetical protein